MSSVVDVLKSARKPFSMSLKKISWLSMPYTLSRNITIADLCSGVRPGGTESGLEASGSRKWRERIPSRSAMLTRDRRIDRALTESLRPACGSPDTCQNCYNYRPIRNKTVTFRHKYQPIISLGIIIFILFSLMILIYLIFWYYNFIFKGIIIFPISVIQTGYHIQSRNLKNMVLAFLI